MQQQPPKSDNMDKAIEYSSAAIMSLGNILIEMFKSIKNRTADDMGYFARNLIIVGGIGVVASFIIALLGMLTGFRLLTFAGIMKNMAVGMGFTCGIGMCSIGAAAYFIAATDKNSAPVIDDVPDVSEMVENDSTDDYEDNLDSILGDLFEDDKTNDDNKVELDFTHDITIGDDQSGFDDVEDNIEVPTVHSVDFDKAVENVSRVAIPTRKILLETFIPFLPLSTPDFTSRKQIPVGSNDFTLIEAQCMKALANILKVDVEEVESSLNEAYETYFSYELKVSRVRGLNTNKLSEFENELEIYFRESANDTSVNATVVMEGDFYKIVITKGVTAIITLGDALKDKKIYNFFLNEENKLPIIAGIGELGDIITVDARKIDSMMIAGKPRSGKSWYIMGMIMSMMMFNEPDDAQFIIIDPKESNLFKTMGLMPHVAGVHSDKDVLNVLDDIINNEAPRRKKLFENNHCDDIWALREKGIKLPVLYVVIDEYITVKSNLEAKGLDKELDSKLQVLISQLPSQGIRVIFVPHRATGVVNKTNRTMLQYMASVNGNNEDVSDTLSIKSWKHNLTNPGDIALKFFDMPEGGYVRGIALTTSDAGNSDLIEHVAKAFYIMGFDMPDTSYMKIAANRDEEFVQKRLFGNSDSRRININDIDLDNMDSLMTEKDI